MACAKGFRTFAHANFFLQYTGRIFENFFAPHPSTTWQILLKRKNRAQL